MQKTHMKLGLLIAIACLFLVAGTFAAGNVASAHTVQSAKKFHHWFAQGPHITVKILSNTTRHGKLSDGERAVIYGVGFNACDCGTGSSTSTTTTTSTTTMTSTTTTSPTTVTGSGYNSCPSDCSGSAPTGSSTTCSSYSNCSGNAPAGPSNQPGPSTTCPSSCGGSTPASSSNQPGPSYNSCPSDCSGSTPASSSNQPGPSYNSCPSDCSGSAPASSSNQPGPSYNSCPSNCSGSAPASSSNQPGPSYNDCGCNTVDLQSSTPISAYTPGINLSQVPVNAFGEFQVVVNVHRNPRPRYYSAPSIWAINSYNDQPSNYASAPMCSCGY